MIKNLAKLAIGASLLSPFATATSQAQQSFTAYSVYRGFRFAGDLASLTTSDADSLTLLPTNAQTGIEMSVNIGATSVSQLTLAIDQFIDYPQMLKVYYMYDWVSMEWRGFYGNVCNTAFGYEERPMTLNLPISRFVSPTYDVRVRVWWTQLQDEDATRDGWFSHVNYAALIVTP